MSQDLFAQPQITAPLSSEERFARLRLFRSRRVGVATFHRLLQEYGSAVRALEALPQIAQSAGVKEYEACPLPVVQAEISAAKRTGAKLICHGEAHYPMALNDLVDAPPLLWTRGDQTLLSQPVIALVGARNASSLGTRMGRKLAAELSEAGFVVVSGMARGVDAAAHQGALERGTIAVLAGGADVIYPTENTELAQDILDQGLIISEQPIGMQPLARHFPLRNRIISGLAQAVVVVEAALKSGSLITAKNALDQGREVLAVPGHPIDARASGCNALIRDGATLIRNAADVIEAISLPEPSLPPTPPEPQVAPPPSSRTLEETAALHQQILDRLGPSPLAEDQLIRDLKLSARRINPELTTLELEGRIERRSGGLLTLIR